MLDAKKNRMDYGEQLIPPDSSYDLDYAVGTTYSLDLEAIMVLPVALFYSRLLDCNPDDLHFDVLDAITRAADKIRVYCQKGKIKVPKKYNRLMAYWEKGISNIRMDTHASSFHPKVWVARFTKQDKVAFYRLLITSRNLTYAHDWDIAFASEGYVGDKLIDKNKPLVSFLQFLEKKDGKDLPKEFIDGLYKVDFKLPDGFHLLNFHPIGFEDEDSRTPFVNPLQKKNWDDLLVISPFVDDASINNLAEKSEKLLNVLSRKEELDGISETLINDIGKDCFFQFSEFIRDAESIDGLSDGSYLEILPQNLHAKIFIGSKSGYQHWFIGSANCTQPAFGRNIEFMVELKTEQGNLSPSKIFKMLTQAKNEELPPFEPYQVKNRLVDSERISLELKLRKIIYDLTGLCFEGDAISRTAGVEAIWDIIIRCDARTLILPEEFEVRIRPLPETDRLPKTLKPQAENIIDDYKGYSEVQLSPFLQVSVFYNSEKVKSFISELNITLPDSRMNSIFKSIIDNREKFLKYLSFLLSGTTPGPVDNEGNGRAAGMNRGSDEKPFIAASLYENLLVAASRRPERLRSLEKIIDRLKNQNPDSESILTDDFMRLWSVFQDYINRAAK